MTTNRKCMYCGVGLKHSKNVRCGECFRDKGVTIGKEWVDGEYLEKKYVKEKLSTIAISRLCGMSPNTIHSRLIKFGIKPRGMVESAAIRKEREMGNGGRHRNRKEKIINNCGYPATYVGGVRGWGCYKPDHISIAEKALGRPMRKGEVVHHINNCRHDNRNENLLICDRSYHQWLHRRMGELYAKEHFPVPQEIIAVIED